METIHNKIEKLSHKVIFLKEPYRESLQELQPFISELKEITSSDVEKKLIEHILLFIKRLINAPTPIFRRDIEVIEQSICSLQLIVEGASIYSVEFPPQIGFKNEQENHEINILKQFLETHDDLLKDFFGNMMKAYENDCDFKILKRLKSMAHNLKAESSFASARIFEEFFSVVEQAIQTAMENENTCGCINKFSESFQVFCEKLYFSSNLSGIKTEFCDAIKKISEESEESEERPWYEGDSELISDFAFEASEHLEKIDVYLSELKRSPDNKEALNSVYRTFHIIKGVAGFLALQDVIFLAHTAESIVNDIIAGKFGCDEYIQKMFGDIVYGLRHIISRIMSDYADKKAYSRDKQTATLFVNVKEIYDSKLNNREYIKTTDVSQNQMSLTQFIPKSRETIKLNADYLESFLDTVNDLIVNVKLVSFSEEIEKSAYIKNKLVRINEIMKMLQEREHFLRIIPVQDILTKIEHFAYEVADRLRKKIYIAISGGDVEIDRRALERVGTILLHLVRNAIDHGIEMPDERISAGKTDCGLIEIKTYYSGGTICLEVHDDGKGIDRNALSERLAQSGNPVPETDTELLESIFLPGISTAKEVSDLSGRGMGMDIVKANVVELCGEISVQSDIGKGSRFAIELPLNMVVVEGLTVRFDRQYFVIPAISSYTVYEQGTAEYEQACRLPSFYLSTLFNVKNYSESKNFIVAIEEGGYRFALFADDVLGKRETVVKSFDRQVEDYPCILCSAIVLRCHTAFIVDIGELSLFVQKNAGDSC